MNGFSERSRVMYGYVIGLTAAFIALSLMNMAQPALIYLVPCTMLPIFVMACVKGHFCRLWHGTNDSTDSPHSSKPNTGEEAVHLNDGNSAEESNTFRQI
ncbi:hypothetical protein ANCCAN_03360 [Ancylostoma caninum]|uniref:Signal peptide peptidase n=1 Tax=Ancylostoma caninum TaxID=29170 RepID=A0A368H1L7_ANCCA|nr:hypothetical protein ANCCAN_03360 [Ancylostoma caninum]